MDREKIEAWTEEKNIDFSDELLEADAERIGPADLIGTFKISGGKLDIKPIRLLDLEIVQQRANQASYAFTLKRYSYTPADPEGCNGMFTHDEFWQFESAGYIASFKNNRMRTFRPFPEWFAEA